MQHRSGKRPLLELDCFAHHLCQEDQMAALVVVVQYGQVLDYCHASFRRCLSSRLMVLDAEDLTLNA